MKKIATITLNPAYDMHGFCDKITLNDTNLIESKAFIPAGKGINVAKVLFDLGIKCAVGGFLGDENSDKFDALFQQFQFEDQFTRVAGQTRINVKITEASGDVTDLNFSGFNVTSSDWETFTAESLIWLKNYDLIVISGSLPKGVELSKFQLWLNAVKQVNPNFIFDSSRDALSVGVKANPFLIKPNEKELGMLIGREVKTLEEIKSAAINLVEQGIGNVVVSLGGEGAIWVSKEGQYFAKPPKCKVVSTVGAGDSMVAGLSYGIATGKSIKETFIFASAIAALSVTQSGVGIPDKAKLDEMLTKIDIRSL